MKSTGGRVTIVLANAKSDWGDSLHFKNKGNIRNMFLPSNSFYSQSGKVLSVNQISFSLFIFGMGRSHNLVTFTDFQRCLCGDTFYYEKNDTESCKFFGLTLFFSESIQQRILEYLDQATQLGNRD